MNFLYSQEGILPCETMYETELKAYSCVARGDTVNVKAAFEDLIKEKKLLGLCVQSIDEAKYRADEIISIAARYAAQSGPGEEHCLGFADECVAQIDSAGSEDQVYGLLTENIVELTQTVADARENRNYPYIIRKALSFIDENYDKNIGVIDVAEVCGVSPDYLSVYFKKHVGEKMTAYIRHKKMLVAKDMLRLKMRCADAALRLSFCSESYFVKCFKDEFGVTPKKWQDSC